MTSSSTPRVLWARESLPPAGTGVLLWDSFGYPTQDPHTISLPRFIEENAEEIRSRLLSFLCDARMVEVNGTSLEARLETPIGLSTWWLSFPSLKQWGTRQSIPIACRLIALEMILDSAQLNQLSVLCDDESLHDVLCRVLQISRKNSVVDLMRRRIHTRVVLPLRAILSLIRYRLIMRSQQHDQVKQAIAKVAFFDYLALTQPRIDADRPQTSPYWGSVPQLLADPSWYYIYPTNIERRGVRRAKQLLAKVRTDTGKVHDLFIQNIALQDVPKVLLTYFRQQRAHANFQDALRNFKQSESNLRLWHIFEDEWNESICGSTAMRHLILLFTTDRLVDHMPRFEKIFYLFENQPWELALLHSAKKYQKGELIGVAHSTIRFWDLRYFLDPRENTLYNNSSTRPLPHRIFTNGALGTSLLTENGYPESSVTMVEALRYSYLAELRDSIEDRGDHVLLLGDFLEHANDVLIRIFREAFEKLEVKPRVQVRSHPICPLTPSQLGPLANCISSLPLATLLKNASTVITTAASSSAAEAAALGIPTVVVVDARTLNYSPFRRSTDVYLVEDAAQLETLLRNNAELITAPSNNIFCLDSNYPRWKSELASPTTTSLVN